MLESSTNRLEFSAISREIFRDKIFNTAGFEFRGQFPYLDKLQYTGFIQWVESQSDYQKFNIQCLVFNNTSDFPTDPGSLLTVVLQLMVE